jgi:uncharacterized membrane protein
MEGVILSAAKNPGESSTTTRRARFHSGFPYFVDLSDTCRRYVTVTVTTSIALTLFVAGLAAPLLASHGAPIAELALSAFFSKLCHQRPDRVLYLFGAPTAVCVRCLGIYAGAAIGGLFRVSHSFARRSLGAALALNILDVAAEKLGLHGNMPLLRLLIGATLGVAVGAMFSAGLFAAKNSAQLGTPPVLH